jgi:penicillin-binding protein 2
MSKDWRNQFPSRRGIFLAGGGIAFAALTARLAELQIFRAQEFDTKARENRIRLEPKPAHRGTIYDRTGRILAGSKRNFYVTINPEQVFKGERKVADVLDELSRIIPLSDSRKRTILQQAESRAVFSDIAVADDLTWEEFAQVNVMAPVLDGVAAQVGELRSYPLQGAFFHTIGYVQKANDKDIMRITEAELKKANEAPDSPAGKTRAAAIRRLYRHPEMRVGKQGVEAFGEQELKGEPGRTRVLVNANGRVIDQLQSDDLAGKAGSETVLALDAELQNYAIQRFGEEAGTAIVIDVATGHVVCMMSTPAPDPNQFVSGIPEGPYQALQRDERNPLYHKAYDGIYPPGSTFKIVVAAAALESGKVQPEDTVFCSGRAWYYNRYYNCYKTEGHGRMNLHLGIQKSCDCYFYQIAERTGIEAIAEMGKKLGLNHRYELGLTGGRSGVMPNNEWKLNNPRIKERWYPGDTISCAIGGGYVLATPFELAVMTARVASFGATPDPHLVVSGFPVPDQAIRSMEGVSRKTLELIRAGMYAVTSEGGGTAIRYGGLDEKNELPAPYTGCRMAGKSGTAQVIRLDDLRDSRGKAIANDKLPWRLRDHALFVAYAPTDKPRYAISIVVEHGGSGSNVAAPLARDILAHALKYDTGAQKPYEPQKREVAGSETTRS